MSLDEALCPKCVGPWDSSVVVQVESPLTKDCDLCCGTEMDAIPWSELFISLPYRRRRRTRA